jgi:hypothetical protein
VPVVVVVAPVQVPLVQSAFAQHGDPLAPFVHNLFVQVPEVQSVPAWQVRLKLPLPQNPLRHLAE